MNKNTTIANQQKSAINHYLNNHPQLSDGIKFINLEKLSKNEEFLTSYSIDNYDRNELQSTLKDGSKYGVMFIDTESVAIHNISKKELNILSNLKDYELDPVYKSVAKEIAQLAPNAPDTTIDLGDSTSFDPNAFEDTFLSFDEGKKALNAFDMPGKAHSENIDNAASSGINSNAQKEGKILGYITRKSFKMNKINKTPNMNNNEQNKEVEKAIDQFPEIRRQPFLVKKDNLHTQTDEKVLSKVDEQLNRVYARKFLKENHFELTKKNIQKVSQNIAQNRANNKKQNRDSSVEAAYKIEKEKLSDPATRSNYQKSSKKHTKNATINQTLLDQNLDL